MICYECSGLVGQDTCHTVSFCEPFEVCYIEERTHFGETFFRSGCKVKHACDSQFSSIPIIGRRSMIERRSTTHVSCCDNTLCNDLSHFKPVYSTSMTTTMQPATTATMTVTTTLPLSTTASKGYPTECADLASDRDGVYTIFPKGSVNEVMVYCMMRGNQKWTVIQRRINGEVDFYKTWAEYKHGFGSVKGEYWLGNDNLHQITSNGEHELSVYVEDFNGTHSYANYTHFVVGDESNKYRLSISGYIGVAGDGLSDGNGHNFTTKDQDNDSNNENNCAVMRHAAWWFKNCDWANLNGLYNDTHGSGPYWYYFHTNTQPLKAAIMMIKRR